MVINKKWAMPNKHTFKIKPIREFIMSNIDKYINSTGNLMHDIPTLIIDPFANEPNLNSLNQEHINYITNDLDPSYNTTHHMDAIDFLKTFQPNSVDIVLYDPPYSPRQVKEVYTKLEKTLTITDTQASVWSNYKKEIARVLKHKGICISFGWNSNGIGKSNGMQQVEILLVAHGGSHNDTIVTVEQKQQE